MAALALLLLPAAAQAHAGSLDRSFGNGGRVTIPASTESEVVDALAAGPGPGNSVIAATNRRVYMLGANGKPQRGFGSNGSVRIVPPVDTTFSVASVAADSRGRVLVAGTSASIFASATTAATPFELIPGLVASSVTVYRLLADGSLDPSFGSGGVATSTLGQLPPVDRSGRSYPVTMTAAIGMAVDSADRPVIGGTSASGVVPCTYLNPDQLCFTYGTFAARLTVQGKVDPSFGTDGAVNDAGLENLGEAFALSPNGDLVLATPTESPYPRTVEGKPPKITILGETGALRSSFPTKGTPEFAALRTIGVATDSRNRILILEPQVNGGGGGLERTVLRRYRRNGTLDPSFGRDGSVSLKLPPRDEGWESSASDLAVDDRDRPLIAAANAENGNSSSLQVTRLTKAGKVDHGFGRAGVAKASFGGPAQAVWYPRIAIDRRERIVLAAGLRDKRLPSGFELGFVRFLADDR